MEGAISNFTYRTSNLEMVGRFTNRDFKFREILLTELLQTWKWRGRLAIFTYRTSNLKMVGRFINRDFKFRAILLKELLQTWGDFTNRTSCDSSHIQHTCNNLGYNHVSRRSVRRSGFRFNKGDGFADSLARVDDTPRIGL